MANKTREILIKDFSGGIILDEKSTRKGVGLNFEELDIFSNTDFIKPEQIVTAETLPANREIYSYTVGSNDTVYAYGRNTSSSKIAILSVATGGASNPGNFADLLAAGAADVIVSSPIAYHEQVESATTKKYVYYISGTNQLVRYGDLGGTPAEATTDVAAATMTLLTGSTFKRFPMLRAFGELYIGHGQYIAKIDDAGTFTQKAFTLPNGWEAVSMAVFSDKMWILCRPLNLNSNETKAFLWDLNATTQFEDSVDIPMGGPQWIVNHNEVLRIFCSKNGIGKFFQLQGAFPIETNRLDNCFIETTTQAVSFHHSVSQKDGILYFGLSKTDKSGLYALGVAKQGQLPSLVLSKRFDTSSYALHYARGVLVHGFNYYIAFDDNGTSDATRCESNNSPTRSSNAVYETIIIDGGDPEVFKKFERIIIICKPLSASTALAVSVKTDYDSSYTAVTRPDGTATFTVTNGQYAEFWIGKGGAVDVLGRQIQIKVAFTSSTTTTPSLQAIYLRYEERGVGGKQI